MIESVLIREMGVILQNFRYATFFVVMYLLVAAYYVYGFYASGERSDGIIILALLTMPIELAVLSVVSPTWSAYEQGLITVIVGLIQYCCIGLFFDIRKKKS